MTREEIENLIQSKIRAGEADTGLYNSGLQYVVVDIVNDGKADRTTFQWFDAMMTIDDLLHT